MGPWVLPAPVEGSDLTVSDAYPRPGADEPAWPDLAGRSRLDDRVPWPRDAVQPGDGDDRQLRAVPPAPHPWQAEDGRLVADDRRPASWADSVPPADDHAARSASARDVAPQAPPPLARDRAVAPQASPASADRAATPGADSPPAQGARARRAPDEIEEAVPATQRVREAVARLTATVRASVPLRTALFVLPPLVLPALAFDLSLGGALVVSVLLLWLAGAAGVVATMMFEGSDQLALRAIERRLDELPAAGRAADDEALLAVGAQLDALNDRLDDLAAGRRGAPDPALEHRPQEQWSTSEEVAENDRYDHDVESGRHWSPPRWER